LKKKVKEEKEEEKKYFELEWLQKLQVLDFSLGTLDDEGGKILVEKLKQEKYKNITYLDLHHHWLTEQLVEQLKNIRPDTLTVDVSEQQGGGNRYVACGE